MKKFNILKYQDYIVFECLDIVWGSVFQVKISKLEFVRKGL